MSIKNDYLVEKRNVLNEIRSNNMTLQELRFFSIYLAKINARDISTRVVRFPIHEFQRIMDMDRLNITQLQNTTDSLLCKIVTVPSEEKGFVKFQIFKRCSFYKENNNEWYIEIDAHDEALPLMFEFKDRYFTYELWNALRLKSSNQLRMYEILKQYEKLGERIISIADLKELLGLEKSEHSRYNNFKVCVLDGCQQALETYTDIKFTYEPVRKKGKGGKIYTLKFTISHNDAYADPLSLADFIDIQNPDKDNSKFKSELLSFLAEACDNEFNEAEIQVLYNLITQIISDKAGVSINEFRLNAYDYLKHRYDELNWRASRTDIKNRFGYLKKLLERDIITENSEI